MPTDFINLPQKSYYKYKKLKEKKKVIENNSVCIIIIMKRAHQADYIS